MVLVKRGDRCEMGAVIKSQKKEAGVKSPRPRKGEAPGSGGGGFRGAGVRIAGLDQGRSSKDPRRTNKNPSWEWNPRRGRKERQRWIPGHAAPH